MIHKCCVPRDDRDSRWVRKEGNGRGQIVTSSPTPNLIRDRLDLKGILGTKRGKTAAAAYLCKLLENKGISLCNFLLGFSDGCFKFLKTFSEVSNDATCLCAILWCTLLASASLTAEKCQRPCPNLQTQTNIHTGKTLTNYVHWHILLFQYTPWYPWKYRKQPTCALRIPTAIPIHPYPANRFPENRVKGSEQVCRAGQTRSSRQEYN